MSIGSLYQYFAGKEAILHALIGRERERLAADIADLANAPPATGLDEAIDALIAIAIRHQLARPVLSRALEYAESQARERSATAALDQRNAPAIQTIFQAAGRDLDATGVQDLLGLVRGMVDAAGLAGETDAARLAARVKRAVAGYLGEGE